MTQREWFWPALAASVAGTVVGAASGSGLIGGVAAVTFVVCWHVARVAARGRW